MVDEVEFLDRLYDLDDLPSTDRRHRPARGDITQHRIANLDWDDDVLVARQVPQKIMEWALEAVRVEPDVRGGSSTR